MAAFHSVKRHIAICHGLHDCHAQEGEVQAEVMTLLEGKSEAWRNVRINTYYMGMEAL